MGLIEKEIVLTSKDASGNTVVHKPYTHVEQVEGAVATVNGNAPDDNGNVVIETGGGMPLGFEYFQTNPNVRAGSLPLTGGTYSRELYADFWAWIQEQSGYLISEVEWQAKATSNGGAVPFYSDGDGSTTFRVPALTVWVKGANGDEAVGDYLADTFKSHKHNVSTESSGAHTHSASTDSQGAHTHTRGTMNITGEWSTTWNNAVRGFHGLTCSGAFYRTTDTSKKGRITSEDGSANKSDTNGYPNFDASRNWTGETSSNGAHTHTITVNSNGAHTHTVTITETGGNETRPKTIIGIYCVIAFTTASPSGSVNLDSLKAAVDNAETTIQTSLRNAETTIQNAANETKAIVEAANGFVRYESYGAVRNRDSSKPTYGLS